MFLFGKKEKHEGTQGVLTKDGACTAVAQAEIFISENASGIKILGTDNALCAAMKIEADRALMQAGSEEKAEHIDDLAVIAAYGVIHTPALVIDGKPVSTGRFLQSAEIATLIKKRVNKV